MAEAKNVVEQPTFGGIPLVYRPPMCAEDDSSEGDLLVSDRTDHGPLCVLLTRRPDGDSKGFHAAIIHEVAAARGYRCEAVIWLREPSQVERLDMRDCSRLSIEAGDLLGKAIRCSGSGVSKYDDPDFPPPQVWSDD
jgi:hypothetical protein